MRRLTILCMFLIMVSPFVFEAQTKPPSFEIASIRPNNSGNGQVAIQTPPGRFRAIAVTAKLLIATAYGIRDPQISGGPAWIAAERFDIEAKIESDAQLLPSQVPTLLQSLLADRFQLKVHRETQELPIFELTVDNGALKLEAAPEPVRSVPDDRRPMSVPTSVPRPGGFTQGFGQMAGSALPLRNLVQALSQQLGRPIVDKTGLTGFYNFTLTWTPDIVKERAPTDASPFVLNGQTMDPNGPSLTTALQEQLGLKLNAGKGPIDVLVIENIQRPKEN